MSLLAYDPSKGLPPALRKYIGKDKPQVQKLKEYYKEESMFAESDNMPNDPEQADRDKE